MTMLPLANFPIMSFEQNNPYLTGMKYGGDLYGQIFENELKRQNANTAGIKNKYLPEELSIANQLKNIELQYAPEMTAAELAYSKARTPHLNAQTGLLGAQTGLYNKQISSYDAELAQKLAEGAEKIKQEKFFSENPLMKQTGPAGQIAALKYIREHPEEFNSSPQSGGFPSLAGNAPQSPLGIPTNQNQTPINWQNFVSPSQAPAKGSDFATQYADLIQKSMISDLERVSVSNDFLKEKAKAYEFNTLTADNKKMLLAKAAGMGIDPLDAARRFMDGESLEEMADKVGVNIDEVEPLYNPTTETLTQAQKRMGAVVEMDKLGKFIKNAVEPYAERFAGYSPAQVLDQIGGKNEEQQARYLAAMGLMPEYAALRGRAQTATIGIEVIREVIDSSMGRIRNIPGVSGKVYSRTQEIMDQEITKAVNAANKAQISGGSIEHKRDGESTNLDQQLQNIVNPDTGEKYTESDWELAAKTHGFKDAEEAKRRFLERKNAR